MAVRNILFDGNSIQTPYIFSQEIGTEGLPTKNAKMYARAHGNSSTIPFVNYPNKTVKVSGTIIGDTVVDLDARLDAFRSYFIGNSKNLDIDYNGSIRRYIATVNSISINRPGGLAFAKFEIAFDCPQPFGQDVGPATALAATARTVNNYTDNLTINGNAPYQLPVITITYTAVTSGANKSLIFGNNNTGQQITSISRTWAANDVWAIDCSGRSCTINGVASDFGGAFPVLAPGANQVFYTDNFTSRSFNISVVYYPMYL